MAENDALACSLDGPELLERLAAWKQLSSHALTRRLEPGLVVTTYPRDEAVLRELRELVAAEAKCCSFLQFEIEEGRDLVTVELRAPSEMSGALELMLGLVGAPTDQPAPA